MKKKRKWVAVDINTEIMKCPVCNGLLRMMEDGILCSDCKTIFKRAGLGNNEKEMRYRYVVKEEENDKSGEVH